jgi:hypothetical protein
MCLYIKITICTAETRESRGWSYIVLDPSVHFCTTRTSCKSKSFCIEPRSVGAIRARRSTTISYFLVVIGLGEFPTRSSFLYTHELARAGGTLSGQSFFFFCHLFFLYSRVASCFSEGAMRESYTVLEFQSKCSTTTTYFLNLKNFSKPHNVFPRMWS